MDRRGAESVVHGLLAAVGPEGTVVAYAGWEDNPYHLAEWPPERRAAYRAGMPPFDPAVSEAGRSHGRLPLAARTRRRTWSRSARSPRS